MRFWGLLGWIIGVPFVFLIGMIILGGIGEGIGAVRKGIVDFFKYPKYYIDEFWSWLKIHYIDIILYPLVFLIMGGVLWGIIYGLSILFEG